MRDKKSKDGPGSPGSKRASGAPPRVIKDTLAKPLARRFYKDVSISDGPPFRILLDGRPVKTPKKRTLEVPTRPLAEAIAEEWRAQEEMVNPARMPLTRFANTAIDAVDDAREAVAAEIAAYAGRDLLCYRAEAPEKLTRLQAKHWDPVIAASEAALGAPLKVVSGVMPVEQPDETLAAVAAALTPHDAFRLAGLHVLTTLMGSAFLTLRWRAASSMPTRHGRRHTWTRITRSASGARTPKPLPGAGRGVPSSTQRGVSDPAWPLKYAACPASPVPRETSAN